MKLPQLSPATVYLIALAAQIAVWDVLAWFCLPAGSTISHQEWVWSIDDRWVPAIYYAGVLLLGLHFFGLPWNRPQ